MKRRNSNIIPETGVHTCETIGSCKSLVAIIVGVGLLDDWLSQRLLRDLEVCMHVGMVESVLYI